MVRYARVAPGEDAGTVTVACTAEDAGTKVEVTYDLSALTPEAATELRVFANDYDAYADGWRHRIEALLAQE